MLSLPHIVGGTDSVIGVTQTPHKPASGAQLVKEATETIRLGTGGPVEDFLQLLATKMGPLWTGRSTVGVASGPGFDVDGRFSIRVGELRQGGRGAEQQGQGQRGVVVEVEYAGEQEDEETEQEGEKNQETSEVEKEVVRAFWNAVGLEKVLGGEGFDHVREVWPSSDTEGRVDGWLQLLRAKT